MAEDIAADGEDANMCKQDNNPIQEFLVANNGFRYFKAVEAAENK